MRAVVCHAYGPPEDLVVDEVADPVPGPGQLVVRVHAAAVNFPDVLMIEGKYQVKAPVPFTPGSELAGEVIAVGEGVSYRPGQRVSATTFVGAFAEQTLLHSAMVTEIPDTVDFASAAAFGVTYRTAYHALRSIAAVEPGDWVVVLGAAGGVGLAAVDLAVAMKAALLNAPKTPLQIEDLPKPQPITGEVLLRVRACGVCRTDLHIADGELPLKKQPLIPGHQIVGIVEGGGTTQLPVGTRVGVSWMGGIDGTCPYCRRGAENLCDAGWGSPGPGFGPYDRGRRAIGQP